MSSKTRTNGSITVLDGSCARAQTLPDAPVTPEKRLCDGEQYEEPGRTRGEHGQYFQTESDSSSEYDTDLEDEEIKLHAKREAKKKLSALENEGVGHVTYEVTCRSLGTVPIRKVTEQLPGRELRLQHVGMSRLDCQALACALWENNSVESLDLQDNGLQGEDLVPVLDILKRNTNIAHLSVSDNRVDAVAAMVIDDILTQTSVLTKLNIAGTGIGDTEIDYIAAGIQHNNSLVWLDLSHNSIGITGAKKLGRALGDTLNLQFLDLSWNHIRLSGAVALLKGVCRSELVNRGHSDLGTYFLLLEDFTELKNESVVHLNLSMNGLGYEGSLALEETLRHNSNLRVLHLANNRINWEGIVYVARGLRRNSTLRLLNIGDNPLNMEGCCVLMKAVASRWCNVEHVGLENVPVNGAVLSMVQDIRTSRHFSLNHGGVLDTKDVIGIRKEKPEDPISLVVRYLAMTGIRIIDMFRMFDVDNDGEVSKTEFIKGMKKIGIPLRDSALQDVASKLDRKKKNIISYSVLVNGVRNHLRAERQDSRREQVKERMKLQKQRQILQTSLPPIFKRNYDDEMFMSYSSNVSIHPSIRSYGRLGPSPRRPSNASQTSYRSTNSTSDLRDTSQILEEDETPGYSRRQSQAAQSSRAGDMARHLAVSGSSSKAPSEITEKVTNRWLKYISMLIDHRRKQAEQYSAECLQFGGSKKKSIHRTISEDCTDGNGSSDTRNSVSVVDSRTSSSSHEKDSQYMYLGRRRAQPVPYVELPKIVDTNRRSSVAQYNRKLSDNENKHKISVKRTARLPTINN